MSDVLTTVVESDDVRVANRPTRRTNSRMRLYIKRFFRNVSATIGLSVFALLVLIALFGHMLTPYEIDDIDFLSLAQPPSATHWFGTNGTGLDLYAMTVHGLGRSLLIAVSVSAGTLLIAAFLGALAAYRGGVVEKIILGVINFMLVCPIFLMEALIAQKSGGNWLWLILVLTVFGWMVTARVIWQLSTSIREREFIAAARYMGAKGVVVVFKHMVPNIGSLLVVQFILALVSTVMSETALSFLGFGIKIPDVSLGSLLMNGQSTLSTTPWSFFFPAGAMTLLTVSVALMADGLRDALDPNSAAGGKA